MKVLYVSKASRVAAHRDKLALLKRSVDLTLVVPHRWGAQPDEPAQPSDPPTVALPAWFHGHNHLHLYRGLDDVLDRERPDLVHADEEPYSAVTGQVQLLCRRRRVPFVFFAWQNLDKRLPPPFGALRRRVFGGAAGGIAGTERAGAVLRRAGFAGPLAIIPQMGVDPERFRPSRAARTEVRGALGLPDEGLLVGFAGRLVPEKGVHVLLEAIPAVPAAQLLIVGSGPEEDALRRRARTLGIEARVHWAGPAGSASMPRWLAALDVLVLPSLTAPGWAEQFGRVLVEAMACGVPVVGSDSGEIPVVIGDAGLVVPEADVAALGEALRRLCARPDERRELARRGESAVRRSYSNDRVAAATLAFYDRVRAPA